MTILRFLKITLITFITLTIFYFIISHILLFFTPNTSSLTQNSKYEVSIFHDRAHTEIIIKTKDLIPTLKTKLKPFIKDLSNGYLAFSYGDQFFMLHIKRWKELGFQTALKALLINTPAVIKVGHYNAIKKDNSIIKIPVSKKTLKKLQTNILNSFKQKDHSLITLSTSDKERYLYYFQAKKAYNLFYTCNTYTGTILRNSNLPVSLWTPLAYQVVYHFPK